MTPITLDEPSAYFNQLARFEADHWWSTALWRIAAHWLDHQTKGRSGLTALDVGCGAGLTLARLAARPEIGRVVGVDPSPEALRHATRDGEFPLIEASALALPFTPRSFDVVTCLDVFQHLDAQNDANASVEIERVLRPGGLAILRTNAEHYRRESLQSLLRATGLRVMTASYVNMTGSILQEIRGRLSPSKCRSRPVQAGLPGRASPGRFDRLMAAIGRAEALAVGRLGLTLPFGHSIMLLAEKPSNRR